MLDVTKRVLLFVEDDDSLLQQMKEYFINLDNHYARIRIHKDYEKIIKILLEVL